MTGTSPLPPRTLTKSRFKLATECPRKLYYVGKPDYADRSLEDGFLQALAQGGYQVGELACQMHPGGVRIDTLDPAAALDQTRTLLARDEVTLFEAALAFGDTFIRVDILRKRGKVIELIEVKAKSYRAGEDGDFRGKKGQLTADFLPYLRDVAFQRWVAEQALPGHRVQAFLMLADKDRQASVDGINQRFRARREGRRLRIDVAPGTDATTLGTPLLAQIPVDGQVDQILADVLPVAPGQALPFAEAVATFAAAYRDDRPLPPMPSATCAHCPFRTDCWPVPGDKRSGFHECWAEAFGWQADDFAQGTVLDLWNFRGKNALIAQGVLKPAQVTMEDLGFKGEPPGLTGLTHKHRQWYQCQPDWPGGGGHYFDREGFIAAAADWGFPGHFIDFETSVVAIPFNRGRRPYEMSAFQFSHHVMERDGRVVHRSQWLCPDPGKDPNVDFLRALKEALEGDEGTIFRWSAHENTVLNQLRTQLLEQPGSVSDQDALVAFIEGITTRKEDKEQIIGPRNMVDLCALAEKHYFHPATKGSTSLKKVLPALMRSSAFLKETYGRPSYGGPGSSLNFTEPMTWWQLRDGEVIDPYQLLPPVFDDLPPEELATLEEGLSEDLREGGAAMAAYARLQFEDLPPAQRQAIASALLRYCELDTLAMVMALQAWVAEAGIDWGG